MEIGHQPDVRKGLKYFIFTLDAFKKSLLCQIKSVKQTFGQIFDRKFVTPKIFVINVLDNLDYEEKVQHQINRSSFEKISENPNKIYEKRVNTWIEKWYNNKSISEKWKKFIMVKHSSPGKMHGNVKTDKIGNPTRVITSGCNTAIENLSIFVENVLYDIASELPSRIKDTNHMLDIIDNLNSLNLP